MGFKPSKFLKLEVFYMAKKLIELKDVVKEFDGEVVVDKINQIGRAHV